MRDLRAIAAACVLFLIGQAWMPVPGSAGVILLDDLGPGNGGSYLLDDDGLPDWFSSERGTRGDRHGTDPHAGPLSVDLAADPGGDLLEPGRAGSHRDGEEDAAAARTGADRNVTPARGPSFRTDPLALDVDGPKIAELRLEGGGVDRIGRPLEGAWGATRAAPVPEPASLFLLGAGLLGLAGVRRKKRGA